jgi:hypothetical protein
MTSTDSDERETPMMRLRKPLIVALAATAALAVAAPAAHASAVPAYHFPMPTAFAGFQGTPVALPTPVDLPGGEACSTPTGVEGQGRTGGNDIYSCMGAGLSFVGPAIGLVSTVIGPTIISPGFAGSVIVSGGNVNVGP